MRRAVAVGVLAALVAGALVAQQPGPPRRTDNVVLVVIDGLRWQEVFTGAEAALIDERAGGVEEPAALKRDFWRPTAEARREALMPFLWTVVAKRGAIWGNAAGSSARVTNSLRFSYPGYNEILTGAGDPRIDANSYGPNPNVTVFEWLASAPELRGRVAVVGGWDAFPRIFNRERAAGLAMWTGWDPPFPSPASPRQATLDALYATTTRYFSDMPFDSMLQQTLLEVLAAAKPKPRVLFVGFGESDEWGHAGRYDLLLRSARAADGYIEELWKTLQSMPEYAGRTALLVTTDHGRGSGPENWKHHDWNVDGAENIWIAAMGPDTPALGERRDVAPVTQSQIAATMAALLGKDWNAQNPAAGAPIRDALGW
jgi:Type I phosphodiesterase / nucleotide pyrophosphatase